MTDTLPLALTGFNYLADINTGMRRVAADTQAIECGGVDIVTIDSNGIDVTGAIKQNGISIAIPIGLGPLPWSGLSAPSGWVLCAGQSLSRTTYANLWAFAQTEIANGNTLFTSGDGSTTFTIMDMRGRIPAGKDDMGGSAAGRLTSTTMSPDGVTLGAVGGAQTATLLTANLPPYTPSGSVSLSGSATITGYYRAGTPVVAAGPGSDFGPTNFTINSSSFSAVFSGVAQGGTSDPVNKVQPTLITNYIIFAGA